MRKNRRDAIEYLQQVADNTDVARYGIALTTAIDALREAESLSCEKEKSCEIYRAALNTFGTEAQIKMLFEEMGELMSAICKYFRGRDKVVHIAEEIADVHILLDQMTLLFDCKAEVEIQRKYKLRRLEQRVKEALGDG